MAKIPRIEQGGRPSGVPPISPLDTSAASMIGTLGGVSEAAMDVVTAAELRERRRWADAMDAKQRIVDASDTGRLTTQFESQVFSIEDALHQEYADNPAAAIDEYMKRSREVSPQIADRGPNDFVKLAVTQGNESTISSGLGRMHSWVSSRQTERVKGNTEEAFNGIANAATFASSAAGAQALLERGIADNHEAAVMSLGEAGALSVEKRTLAAGAENYVRHALLRDPFGTGNELRTSEFLKNTIKGGYAGLVADADNAYSKINAKHDLDIVKEAAAAGEKLVYGIGVPEFVPAAAARLRSLEMEKEEASIGINRDGTTLKPADAKARVTELNKQIERVKTLQTMSYKQLDSQGVDDPDTVTKLTIGQNDLTGKIAKTAAKKNLNMLQDQMDAILFARDQKKITYGTATVMQNKLALLRTGAIDEQKSNDGFWIWHDAEETGIREIQKLFKTSHSEASPDQQNSSWIEYTRRLNDVQRSGGKMSPVQAVKMAQQIVSLKTGKKVPGAFK